MRTDKKPSLQQYDDGWENRESVPLSMVEMQELIEQKIDNKPVEGKLKSIWKRELNSMIREYNERAGYKAYCHVH